MGTITTIQNQVLQKSQRQVFEVRGVLIKIIIAFSKNKKQEKITTHRNPDDKWADLEVHGGELDHCHNTRIICNLVSRIIVQLLRFCRHYCK